MKRSVFMVAVVGFILSGCSAHYPVELADKQNPEKVALTPKMRTLIADRFITISGGTIIMKAEISEPHDILPSFIEKYTKQQMVCTRIEGIDSTGRFVKRYTITTFIMGSSGTTSSNSFDRCSNLGANARYHPFPEVMNKQATWRKFMSSTFGRP